MLFLALYNNECNRTTKSSFTSFDTTGSSTCELLSFGFGQNICHICLETVDFDRRKSNA